MAGDEAHEQPGAGARIAHVENVRRFDQAADADAVDLPVARSEADDGGTQAAHAFRRMHHVVALEQARHLGPAHGDAAENQCAVGNRLVAGYSDFAGEGGAGLGTSGRHVRVSGSGIDKPCTYHVANRFDRPCTSWQSDALIFAWRTTLAKPEWGVKRQCLSCGARFYDMGRDPIVCPKCEAVFEPEAALKIRRARPDTKAAKVKTAAAATAIAVGVLDDDEIEDEDRDAEDGDDEDDDVGIAELDGGEEDLIADASDDGEDDDGDDIDVDDAVEGDDEEDTLLDADDDLDDEDLEDVVDADINLDDDEKDR